jgi:Uncharacterised protein family (UPF0158)
MCRCDRYRDGVSAWTGEDFRALRAAVYRAEGSVVGLVRGRLTDDVLQLAGEGLLDATAQMVDGAAELASECAAALRKRRWDGDEELAGQLDAARGAGPAPLLRALPVDLDELASMREGDPIVGGCRIDVRSGGCWPVGDDFIDEEDDEDDDERWLYAEPIGSGEGYRDMELFIASVNDADFTDRLEIAISGRGAFRRFKDVLSRWPEQFNSYYQLSSERQRGRARAWLASEGFRPVRERA